MATKKKKKPAVKKKAVVKKKKAVVKKKKPAVKKKVAAKKKKVAAKKKKPAAKKKKPAAKKKKVGSSGSVKKDVPSSTSVFSSSSLSSTWPFPSGSRPWVERLVDTSNPP